MRTKADVTVWSYERIEGEVQHLVREVSFKYAPEPPLDGVESDMLIALKRFRQSVRTRPRFVDANASANIAKERTDDESTQTTKANDLGTNLCPTGGCGPDDNIPTSNEVEGFLYDAEKTFLDYLDDMKKKDGRKVDNITRKINNIFSKLKQRNDIVVARTDKTNSIRVMKTTTYIKLVERHLQKDAVLTDYAHLQEVHKKAIELLATINDLVGENEYKYIKSTITKRAVPTVQLLIKDHKKIDESTGEYPSRLVVPAKNYTAAYPHVGQRGIFEILRKNEVNFTERNIQQASELKEKLEQLPIRKSDNTIITLDIEAMYPSVKFI